MFGGSKSSQSSAQSQTSLNSSGWVVGSGSAEGGSLSSGIGNGLPWYAWASFGIIALAVWKYKIKR